MESITIREIEARKQLALLVIMLDTEKTKMQIYYPLPQEMVNREFK